ncbi:MAG: glycosyltransferase [Pseudomonadota bacterium]
MRIALIGPVSPFRGGIARHTTALARALAAREGVTLDLWSFRRLYPRRLYPGESDRDPDAAPPEALAPRFALDAVNPLSWRGAARRIAAGAPDLAVLPAWTFFVAPCLGTLARGLRARGVPVAMVVHNAADHEGARLKRALSRWQLAPADRFVTHTAALADDIRALVPGRPVGVTPHPAYDDFPAPQGPPAREAALELLFFGLVRPYKGLDIAIEALAASGLTDVRLTVAGEFWIDEAAVRARIAELGLEARVTLIPRYVSDAEAAALFHRADAVLAPYRSVTGSGVVAMARHYGRPVIASRLPGLEAAIRDGETGWLSPPGDAAALGRLIAARVTRAGAAAMEPAVRAAAAAEGWDAFAEALLAPGPPSHPS